MLYLQSYRRALPFNRVEVLALLSRMTKMKQSTANQQHIPGSSPNNVLRQKMTIVHGNGSNLERF